MARINDWIKVWHNAAMLQQPLKELVDDLEALHAGYNTLVLKLNDDGNLDDTDYNTLVLPALKTRLK